MNACKSSCQSVSISAHSSGDWKAYLVAGGESFASLVERNMTHTDLLRNQFRERGILCRLGQLGGDHAVGVRVCGRGRFKGVEDQAGSGSHVRGLEGAPFFVQTVETLKLTLSVGIQGSSWIRGIWFAQRRDLKWHADINKVG